jgi:predicted nucleic acid-binding protein
VQFVDTNVLLYAVSTAPEELGKAAVAREILHRRDLALSVQVLQEFYVQATRESRPDRLRHDQAVRLIDSFCRYPAQELTLSILRAALGYPCSLEDFLLGCCHSRSGTRQRLRGRSVGGPLRSGGLRWHPGRESVS